GAVVRTTIASASTICNLTMLSSHRGSNSNGVASGYAGLITPSVAGITIAASGGMAFGARKVMAPVRTGRAIVRELVALTRNYRYAAILRRQLRAKYGRVVVGRPSVLIGEALLALDRPRTRLVICAVLLGVATRIKFGG